MATVIIPVTQAKNLSVTFDQLLLAYLTSTLLENPFLPTLTASNTLNWAIMISQLDYSKNLLTSTVLTHFYVYVFLVPVYNLSGLFQKSGEYSDPELLR